MRARNLLRDSANRPDDRGSPNADLDGRGRGGATRPSGYTDGDPGDPAGTGRRHQGGPP